MRRRTGLLLLEDETTRPITWCQPRQNCVGRRSACQLSQRLSRLLAIFRAVYAGIEHETLRLPPWAGHFSTLTDFPLEGRGKDSNWKKN